MFKKIILPLCSGLLLLSSCSSPEKPSPESPSDNPPAKEKVEIKLTPFSESAPYPDAVLESYTYKDKKFKFSIKKYELGIQTPDAADKKCANSADGQHLHIIIDNQPYIAQYKPEFELEIPDGEHILMTFLSRSYHESIKTAKAYKASKVMVENNSIKKSEPVATPMLFYSRPKGQYVKNATKDEVSKVMLDFFVTNCELSPTGYKVLADVNGTKFTIDKWQPYYLEGLPIGKNTVTLELVDATGSSINKVSRDITLLIEN